jgi:hypothetical protein
MSPNLAAQRARALRHARPSPSGEGAGKTGCTPHPWSACSKKARGRTTGTSRTTGLPCAMVLRLIRDLPGDQALLPPSLRVISQSLTPALGRQDHTTSPSASCRSSHNTPRPSHPAPYVRDDREATLLWVRDARMIVLICPTWQRPSGCGTLARRADSVWLSCTFCSSGRRRPTTSWIASLRSR